MMFVDDIKAFASNASKSLAVILERAGNDLAKSVVMGGDGWMVNGTPVDTGRARGNWRAGINSANTYFDENDFDKDGTMTVIMLEVVIKKWSKYPIDTLHITNSTPYIEELENEAKSRQAPRGMAKVAIPYIVEKLNRGFYK